jgi:hypothetical protein
MLLWDLKEVHERIHVKAQFDDAPTGFAQFSAWLKQDSITPLLELERPKSGAIPRQYKRSVTCYGSYLFSSAKARKSSSRQVDLNQRAQPLATPIITNANTNTEHGVGPPITSDQAEVPQFRESQPPLDIHIIDNRLEVQAYDQGHYTPSPVIANNIDYNTQPSFDPGFYPQSYQMASDHLVSSNEHFNHSPYSTTTQHDPWNRGSNASNMPSNDQTSDQDMLFDPSHYYSSDDRYNYPYGHQQQ